MKPNSVFVEVLEHLESTYRQKQSVEDLCSQFGMSPSVLRRLFKKHTGLGVKEFVILLRITESKRLLQQSDAKVAAIAYDIGFDNLSAFNRDFKLATGMSPTEYRKLAAIILKKPSISVEYIRSLSVFEGIHICRYQYCA